jgi:hypothetical protein
MKKQDKWYRANPSATLQFLLCWEQKSVFLFSSAVIVLFFLVVCHSFSNNKTCGK